MAKENKYRHSCQDMFNRTDLNPFTRVIRDQEREFGFDVGVYETSEKMKALPNKLIELKAENKELAELKNRMFKEAEKQNEEIKRLNERTSENVAE